MHHFRGKLLKGDKTHLDPANVYMDYRDAAGDAGQGWDGYLLIASESEVEAGATYTLRLVDGRAGSLRIATITPDEAGKVRAAFVGEGDLK